VRKMNILMMSSSTGVGLTYHISRLLIELKKMGVNVAAIADRGEQESGLSAKIEAQGVRLYRAELDSFNPLAILRGAKTTRNVLLKERTDVVHVQGVSQMARACLARFHLNHGKSVYLVYTLNNLPWNCLYSVIDACADLVIAPTEQVRRLAINAGISCTKIKVVHNWLDINQFDEYMHRTFNFSAVVSSAFSNADNTLVYLANLYKHKDHATLFHSLCEVIKEYPRTKVLLLGQGPEEPFLRELSARLNIAKNIVFAGRVCYEWVPKILSMADFGVVTSTRETFGHAIIEPLAAKKPVISTPVGVAPEIAKHNVGLIVRKEDPEALSSAILYLIENPKEARAMGLNGRQLVQEMFSVETIASALRGVYDSIATDFVQ